MRFLIGGPRIFGLRTGVIFGRRDLEKFFGSSPKAATGQLFDPDHGFIYVIKGNHGLCKIGITGNPRVRLNQLRNGSAHPIEFAWIGAPARQTVAIEQDAHEILGKYRRHGEWFEVSYDVAVGAISAAAAHRKQNVLGLTLEQADQIVDVARKIASSPQENWISRHFVLSFFIALAVVSTVILYLADTYLFVN